jgi:hypothetical protein
MVADTKKIHAGNLNNVRCETSRTFKDKIREYLKKLRAWKHNKNENIGGSYICINKCKKGYKTTINLVRDENGNQLEHINNVLNSGKIISVRY